MHDPRPACPPPSRQCYLSLTCLIAASCRGLMPSTVWLMRLMASGSGSARAARLAKTFWRYDPNRACTQRLYYTGSLLKAPK